MTALAHGIHMKPCNLLTGDLDYEIMLMSGSTSDLPLLPWVTVLTSGARPCCSRLIKELIQGIPDQVL